MAEENKATEQSTDAPKKKISLKHIDGAAEEKGSLMKTIWQIVKFLLVSSIVTIIQIGLAYLLPLIFDKVTTELPAFLQVIFRPDSVFDASTASGLKDIAKYVVGYTIADNHVVGGIITWGYVLPFFLSNLIANIYGYIQNKKTTFKSDAPKYCFVIYIILMICLILFSTWLQGVVYGALSGVSIAFIRGLARLIASGVAGFVQMIVLFPMEKFVLLKEKKPEDKA